MTAMEQAPSMRGTALEEPHHDGSELYLVERPEELGDTATVRVRVAGGDADEVYLRYVADGEPRTVAATRDEPGWWRASFPARNVVTRYRWLLAGGTPSIAG